MYNQIFRRVEEKYLLTEQKYKQLMKRITKNIEPDEYFETTINNIYFDTKNNDLIINSMDKPLFKEKIRLRSYGIPKQKDSVFLEIKEKYKGVVGKRRMKLTLKEFYSFQNKRKISNNTQIMREIAYYFQYYDLKPAIYIGYDRISYRGIEDKNLRITFDHNLRSRREDLLLELGDVGKKHFKNNECIMEIKTLGSMPLWLVRILSELKIYPTSFSKYGEIYKKEILNKEKIYVK